MAPTVFRIKLRAPRASQHPLPTPTPTTASLQPRPLAASPLLSTLRGSPGNIHTSSYQEQIEFSGTVLFLFYEYGMD